MFLDNERESSEVEDRRGDGPGFPGGLGLGAIILALVGSVVFGIDPSRLMHSAEPEPRASQTPESNPRSDPEARFVAKVLASTEDVWTPIFEARHSHYRKPRLVLFTGSTPTACGSGQAAMGPFYCPADERVYIDLSFYRALKNRFHAPGEFAEAYVIAHEVGHHVQKLRGISSQVEALEARAGSSRQRNALSVRLELQADCFAGVWGHHADRDLHLIAPGEMEEAIRAAAAIGDDTLQREARGYAVPETFTHGTSSERVAWFKRGFETGDPKACNPFKEGPDLP
jgi:predicted metalloprotease